MPPLLAKYTKEEIDEKLIHSTKAFHVCKSIALVYSECRKMPLGKVVEPESCLNHAEALMTCYNHVKKVPDNCKNVYGKLKTCLHKNKKVCEKDMNDYILCDHPAQSLYRDYQKENSISNNQ